MLYAIYFIYGLCVMFYFMMSWLFYRKDKKLLSRLVAVMMFVIGLQCLKDLFFIKPFTEIDKLDWMVITAADMIVVPLYVFVLIELCSPSHAWPTHNHPPRTIVHSTVHALRHNEGHSVLLCRGA